MSADVAFFLCVLGGRLCHGGLCQGQAQILLYRGVGKPKTVNVEVRLRQSVVIKGDVCFIRRKYSVVQGQLYPPRNSFTLRHLLYRRRPVPTKCTSSSSMFSSSPSSCTSVFDKGLIFLSPMEFRSASSERGADESTGRKSRRDGIPTCHQGCSLALSFVEGTVAVLTWCSWFTVRRSSGSGGCCARFASSGDWRAEGEFRSVKAGCTKQCRGGGPEGLF